MENRLIFSQYFTNWISKNLRKNIPNLNFLSTTNMMPHGKFYSMKSCFMHKCIHFYKRLALWQSGLSSHRLQWAPVHVLTTPLVIQFLVDDLEKCPNVCVSDSHKGSPEGVLGFWLCPEPAVSIEISMRRSLLCNFK